MPDDRTVWQSGIHTAMVPEQTGAICREKQVVVSLRTDRFAFNLTARNGMISKAITAVEEAFGIGLPETMRYVAYDAMAFIWAGRGRWIVQGPKDVASEVEIKLRRCVS